MATRKPLVIISGTSSELPPGDSVGSAGFNSSEGAVQFLSSVTSSSTAKTGLDTFPSGTYNTVIYTVQAKRANEVHSSDIKLVHNSSDVYTSEYGMVYSSGLLATYSGVLLSGQIELNAYANTSASTQFRVLRYAQLA
jgi:hypothetical protein